MSDLLIKLWQNGILQLGIWETIYMTLISTFFAYLIGLPVGLILRMTDRDGIHPIGWLNRTLGIIVNALRSIPFIILMVAMLPVAKAIVGTSLGNRAVIVTLVIAAAPYVARMVESAAKEVDAGVIEAALSMGASTLLNTTLNLVTPLLFASSPAFFVNLLFFTQGIGTSGSQSLLGRYATDIGFWHKTNLVLLALGAAAVLLLAFSTVPGPRADGPHPAKRQSGVLKNRAALPLVFVFGFYFIAEHGVMNWLVAYATAGLGMEQAKASNYLAVFFGGVMLGRLVLSPLVDRLGILKSMGVFGSLSAVLYIAGVVGGAAAMPLWAAGTETRK